MDKLYARHLLTPLKTDGNRFFAADWNMNLYHGCCHGCIYCDSRSLCYHLTNFDTVRPKENALPLLERELRSKQRTGIVAMGSMTDPYNPMEKSLLLTRRAIELLRKYRFGVSFTTKSNLCARDAALCAEIAHHAPVRACLTVTCAEDDLCSRIEPHVSPTSRRLEAVSTLRKADVYTGVWIAPVLPFMTDTPENLLGILRKAADAGAQYAMCSFGMTLRSGNREYFFDALVRDFPGVRELYLKHFGNDYFCPSPKAEALYSLFHEECQRLHLACTYRDINEQTIASAPQQMSLWDNLSI